MSAIRIALPKGRLLAPLLDEFRAAGYDVPTEDDLASRRLLIERGDVEWILVKDGDVPVYVEGGAADAGVAGLDQLLEQKPRVFEPLDFGFGRCRMMLIGAPGVRGLDLSQPRRLATKYPRLSREWLERRGLRFEVLTLQGSVELAAVLRLTPYVIDLVETGGTVRAHGLELIEVVEEISPRLIVNPNVYRSRPTVVRRLIRSLAGVSEVVSRSKEVS
ncbi:MAG: ATP phosphoribosyltransferase [Thermoanaerobaculia bacterium]